MGVAIMRRCYKWQIPSQLADEHCVDGSLCCYMATVALKRSMSQKWTEASLLEGQKAAELRQRIAMQVVSEWGGIRGNRSETIDRYCAEGVPQGRSAPFHGIASRSKILAIAEPERFAIMDARVVIALNAIQLLGHPSDGQVFPYLPSRNKNLGRSCGFLANTAYSREAILARHPHWKLVTRGEAYECYLNLLADVSEILATHGYSYSLLDLEMTLFSQAEELTERLRAG